MSREIFLQTLRRKLAFLPQNEIEERIAFYAEIIDERMADGMSENDAAAAAGSPDEIAQQMMCETPFKKIISENVKSKSTKNWNPRKTALILLTIPLWAPLAFALTIFTGAIFFSIWIIAFALMFAAALCLFSFILSIPQSIEFFKEGATAAGIFILGEGLCGTGLAILVLSFSDSIISKTKELSNKLVLKVKSFVAKKENRSYHEA